MKRTAIILAGGFSRRFGKDKGLVELAGKPLVLHVFDRICSIVDEVLVIVSSDHQKRSYSPFFPADTKIFVDVCELQSPLVGALTGFINASGDYSVLLPCDAPFVSGKVLELLFEVSFGVDAVIPRWPNGYIEPLQAVYKTNSAVAAAKSAIQAGEVRPLSMISRLDRVRYLSTIVIDQLSSGLTSFFNINTLADLKKAEKIVEESRDGKNRFSQR